ncbi:MAG: sugar ABC transporter permease [Clostridia bacterium]|nr:sugar ABC transporter permease [Clostridia bacterium]
MLSAIRPKSRVIFGYLLIPIVFYVFAVFVPLMTAAFFSFFNWKGGPNKTFNGVENYLTLLKDSVFWQSFGHNIYLVVASIIGQIGLAFIFVLIINSKLVKFKGIHRTFGFFPSTIAAVSIGFIWTMIYDYKRGLLNWFLALIGNAEAAKVWLNDEKLVMLLVSIPLVWQWIGYYMVIILSAISSIDKEIFEVSELDGANAVQQALHIIIPLIKNTLLVCVTLCVAGNMKAFDHIWVMTKGGPGNESMVMALYGYNISFAQQNMGYGSAISVGIFIASLLVIAGTQFIVKLVSEKN